MISWLENRWAPVVLLCFSNLFMTTAWYGHLKHKDAPLLKVLLASWGIAFFEYLLMVPANRYGSYIYSATELKIIQEVVTLTVFSGFAILYLGERMHWNHIAAFACILAAVAFTFLPGKKLSESKPANGKTSASIPSPQVNQEKGRE